MHRSETLICDAQRVRLCCAACAALLMLLAHFNEQEDKMLINVDDTAIVADLDTIKLPWTPCIVVCEMFVKTILSCLLNHLCEASQLPIMVTKIYLSFLQVKTHLLPRLL